MSHRRTFLHVTVIAFAVALVYADALRAQRPVKPSQQETKIDADRLKEEVALPQQAVAVLIPTAESDVRGVITLQTEGKGVVVRGKVTGLKPGLHGFHIHEFGDLRDPQAKSAGGHFAPHGHKHGGPEAREHHAGDLGNIRANQDGVADINIKVPWLKLHFIVGRSIVVHAEEDDLKSQPSGAAGDRVAISVIGIAQTRKKNN